MIIVAFLIFAMLAVLWFDVRRYIIPNWLCGFLLILYPVAVFMAPAPVDWKEGLIAMAIVFAVGYIVFARNWMGGGDVKLLIASSPWVGLSSLMEFIFTVAILGGVLSVAVFMVRKIPVVASKGAALPRVLRSGEPIPYGVAISIAFLLMMKMGKIPAIAGVAF